MLKRAGEGPTPTKANTLDLVPRWERACSDHRGNQGVQPKRAFDKESAAPWTAPVFTPSA